LDCEKERREYQSECHYLAKFGQNAEIAPVLPILGLRETDQEADQVIVLGRGRNSLEIKITSDCARTVGDSGIGNLAIIAQIESSKNKRDKLIDHSLVFRQVSPPALTLALLIKTQETRSGINQRAIGQIIP
jgi:hypothetical protein